MKNPFQLFGIFLLVFLLSPGVLLYVSPATASQPVIDARFHRGHTPKAGELPLLREAQMKSLRTSSPVFTGYDGSSDNWAGYTAGSGSGNGFKAVEGNWNAPCTSGSTDSSHLYGSWVGLGGYFSGESLEQAGIALQTDGTYRMFWEYVWSTSTASGDPPVYDTTDIVHCRDSITAWVEYGTSYCSNGGFYAHVQDNTTGGHLGSTCLTASHGYGIQSADWIDERPWLNSCNSPSYLADFNYTEWSNVQAQPNLSGASYANPNSFTNNQLLMDDITTSTYIAYPDGLQVNSDNTFTNRWYYPGTYCD